MTVNHSPAPLNPELVETSTAKIPQLFPDAIYVPIPSAAEHPFYHYEGKQPGISVLRKDHIRSPGHRAFPIDVVYERDTVILVRDGVKLYADIFRPAGAEENTFPAIIPYSPYGKTGSGPYHYDTMAPYRAGIDIGHTSGYEKFEGPDPAEWCARGYAIINIDARGTGDSEGVIAMWGLQEAEDVHDVIDWASKQPWCNGSVAMAGNSWLSMSQVNFAARLSHAALKCIAPWEAQTDVYRQLVTRGGVPHHMKFRRLIRDLFAGAGSAEDALAMLDKRPLYDEYWEAKRFPVEQIDNIPMYLLASYSSSLHTQGSFATFRDAKTKTKWLRVHPFQEWYDIYRPEVNDDLQRFYDRYCKDVKNGWEDDTAPVRLWLLGFEADGGLAKTVLERPEQEYPLAREHQRTLYLSAGDLKLCSTQMAEEATVQYEAHSLSSSADFSIHFDRYTELAGWCKVKLFVSCAEHDDMDIVVQIRKIDASGRPLKHLNYPVPVPIDDVPDFNVAKTLGPQGFLRASHAVSLDPAKSQGNDLFYTHRVRQPLEPGTVAELDIPIWPIGMAFGAGEGIMLRVSGHDMCLPETEMCRVTEPEDANVGTHVVHTGDRYASALTIPVIASG
ncbi:hypothetical protein LTR53_011326 [Teratosphaeriaceae sp. CCFEE 6253]|nr:hypothetical protein LTR53_011326 [Teratosphaeriaceae sp. CCFEE 6253]